MAIAARTKSRRFAILGVSFILAVGVLGVAVPAGAAHLTGSLATYTLDADFDEGTLVNVNHDAPNNDQLQLNSEATPFEFIWVAASARGTVVKIDTVTGAILGEYRSTPSSVGPGNPSRTTVDSDGSVWVANRNTDPGSVLHIGLEENGQCEDRDGSGTIDTSTGLGDIKAWADESGTRSVATAVDECIVHFTRVSSTGTRHVSVDANNDVWVSGTGIRNFDLVKGGRYDVAGSGTILRSEPSVGFGGYGGLIDGNGVIWSARNLLRWDVANPLSGPNGDPAGPSIGPPVGGANWSGQFYDSYGLCIDPFGNVWNTQLSGNTIRKYAPDGTFLGAFGHGNPYAQGCVADANGDIWVAHSLIGGGQTTVGHLLNDGTFVGNVALPGGRGPTGVAVDAAGKVWAANIYSNNVSRIDPASGPAGAVDLTVNLGGGAGPYNYSDMTGSTLIAPPNSGTWTIVHDCGTPDAEWGRLSWTSSEPGDSSLTVTAASGTAVGGPFSAAETAVNGGDLSVPDGQFLQAVVSFERATTGESPILFDLTFDCRVVAEADKWWSHTDVCFESDNDLDGRLNEDPVDFAADGSPIDNDGDGLFNEDDSDCDPASLGTPLDMKGDNYTVDGVVGKNGKVKNYNPGQTYAVTQIDVLVDGALTIHEDYSDCTLNDVLELNPKKGGGRLVVVRDNGGTPEQILDAKDIEAAGGVVGANEATFDLDAAAGDVLYVFVKFAPADADVGSTCINTTTVSGEASPVEASGVLEVVAKH